MIYPTSRELWAMIGGYLQQERERRQWNLIDVQHRGGPNYATVQEHEAGRIRTISKLEAHCGVFNLELVNILARLLGLATEVEVDAVPLLGKFTRTTPSGREALLRVAAVLPYDNES